QGGGGGAVIGLRGVADDRRGERRRVDHAGSVGDQGQRVIAAAIAVGDDGARGQGQPAAGIGGGVGLGQGCGVAAEQRAGGDRRRRGGAGGGVIGLAIGRRGHGQRRRGDA